MKFIITDIEFDTDGDKKQARKLQKWVGKPFEADSLEDANQRGADIISDQCGFCIISLNFKAENNNTEGNNMAKISALSIKKPFIVKAFEASSSHITPKDDKLLKQKDLCSLATYEVRGGGILYGFLIYTGLKDNTSIHEMRSFSDKAIKAEGYSKAFINLLKIARKNGCKFLQLDCDGVEYDDLPTFDW
jgi:hypothetical protein